MPAQINQQYHAFQQFYSNKHPRRTLTLCYSLGQAVVTMKQGEKRPTDLVVSTIAMFLLMMFNEKQAWTVQELTDAL